jgi:macrophage erythroblast attacher
MRTRPQISRRYVFLGSSKDEWLTSGQNDLEFQLRLQQYIEMVRDGDHEKILGAALHFRKYLTGYEAKSESDKQLAEFSLQAAGLLAFDEDTMTEPFSVRCHIMFTS